MRQSLLAAPADPPTQASARPPWLRLPLLCCQAAGGEPRWAEPVAAAWALLYAAAHLLDSLQDGDPPEPWWEALGPGPASNVATGLIATCSLLLTHDTERPRAFELIRQDFFQTVLQMSSGQHRDLTAGSPSLEECWRVAEAKSGGFFGLACRAGARIAGIDEALVSHYSTYGTCLGLLVQIGDDLADLAEAKQMRSSRGRLAIPMAYYRAVASPEITGQSAQVAGGAQTEAPPAQIPIELLEASGMRLYLSARAHELRQEGCRVLEQAAPSTAAVEELQRLIRSTPRSI
jgi:geranylgeranyl diphosphate synthase type I